MEMRNNLLTVFALLFFINGVTVRGFEADYNDALAKSLLFLEAQRSGYLPPNQRVTWRGNSGLQDGSMQGVDLVGGYYDAGDHVKFGLPMAFTVTMLSWSIIEYEKQIAAAGQLDYALDAIKWATDYIIKAHPEPNVLWGQVGDGDSDHACWQRAEDMTTPRGAYRIDSSNPGSDLAGETAAAMAAASMAFKYSQPQYSETLLQHSIQLFEFADKYRRKYDSSIFSVKKFYQSASGYGDELLWGAMWLYQATNQDSYLQYVVNNAESLGGVGWNVQEFTWDVKYAGVQILANKMLLEGKGGQYTSTLEQYQERAQFYLCSTIQKNSGYNVDLTPGGMIYLREWDNMQHVSNAAFLLAVSSDYYTIAQQKLQCSYEQVDPSQMLAFSKSQADYILGNNPMGMSYIVGYGPKSPLHVHHRGASMVSYKQDTSFIPCMKGYADWYNSFQPNPNVLVGALVGGPDQNDNYEDNRDNYKQSEPTTYNNAPLLGLFAKLNTSKLRMYSLNLPIDF
ncbi:endoglucanase 11-like [Cryptomeria japonica]|uniref:endoglucanase 11-like n=1 Tax=Cryptomeria japonica TaxID=3369 RepID=UPI0027DA4D59|nr:endoglucanase 11-like [Cryptomeria japonica]